ncbi:MAG: cytochrome bc complex cytochrome b subunit, partial [Candidatus Margulisiibacteriota bacterium]
RNLEYDYKKEGPPFFPNHLTKEAIAALLIIALVISLAVFFPAAMELKANPFDTPPHIKPEWYFLGTYQILKAVPNELLGISISGVLIMLLFLTPFIDRNPSRKLKDRKLGLIAFFSIIALLVIFTIWGKIS